LIFYRRCALEGCGGPWGHRRSRCCSFCRSRDREGGFLGVRFDRWHRETALVQPERSQSGDLRRSALVIDRRCPPQSQPPRPSLHGRTFGQMVYTKVRILKLPKTVGRRSVISRCALGLANRSLRAPDRNENNAKNDLIAKNAKTRYICFIETGGSPCGPIPLTSLKPRAR